MRITTTLVAAALSLASTALARGRVIGAIDHPPATPPEIRGDTCHLKPDDSPKNSWAPLPCKPVYGQPDKVCVVQDNDIFGDCMTVQDCCANQLYWSSLRARDQKKIDCVKLIYSDTKREYATC